MREVMLASRREKDMDFGGDIVSAADFWLRVKTPAYGMRHGERPGYRPRTVLFGDIASAGDFGLERKKTQL